MFSRSKPEWEGLSGGEKKTVRDNKKQLSPFAQHDNVSQGNVTWSRTKHATKGEFNWIAKLLIRPWRVRAACNLYPCPRSFISPFFDHHFLLSLFPSSFFFLLVPSYFFPLKFVSWKNKENPWNQDTCYNRRTVWIMDSHYYPTHNSAS